MINDFGGRSYAAQAGLQDRISFVRGVYLWLMSGFVVAGLSAYAAYLTQSVWGPLLQKYSMFIWLIFGAQMGAIFFAQAVSRRRPLNILAFGLFTGISGYVAGMIATMYMTVLGPGIVVAAAGMTAGDFLVLTAVTFVTKKDFDFLRNFVIIGVAVMFFGGLIAGVAVIACSAKILYDTSAMLRTQDFSDPAGFALSLFVSLYNIFISLLRLLGGRRN